MSAAKDSAGPAAGWVLAGWLDPPEGTAGHVNKPAQQDTSRYIALGEDISFRQQFEVTAYVASMWHCAVANAVLDSLHAPNTHSLNLKFAHTLIRQWSYIYSNQQSAYNTI